MSVYTATKLITNAYYLSNRVARNYETVTGDLLSDGLDLLNDLLAVKTANNRLIPYYEAFDFQTVIGQEKYNIPNCIDVITLTFFLGTVRYSTQKASMVDYFGSARAKFNTLIGEWHMQRVKGGTDIYVYPFPDKVYNTQIWAKFGLDEVTLNQDLSLTYDRYYITYLRYALAEYIANENNIQLPGSTYEKLLELEQMITDISPLDLTMQKLSSMTQTNSINYGQVNLGHGWTKP